MTHHRESEEGRMPDSRESHLTMIQYFWSEKGDLERYSSWQDAEKEFPEIAKAWSDYKMAEKILTAVINGVKP